MLIFIVFQNSADVDHLEFRSYRACISNEKQVKDEVTTSDAVKPIVQTFCLRKSEYEKDE